MKTRLAGLALTAALVIGPSAAVGAAQVSHPVHTPPPSGQVTNPPKFH
jgi:hypothetical protein